MNVLVADSFESSGLDGLKGLGCTVTYEPGLGAERLGSALAGGGHELLIVRSTKVTSAAIHAATGLRAIIRAGAGVDNIDLPAATARGISVGNCPGMNAVAVAELALGLLIACDRRVSDQSAAIKAGQWNKKEFTRQARGLKGSTLAVVGFGAIGQEVAKRALAFDMQVAGWGLNVTPALARAHGVRSLGSGRAELLAFLPQCHAVSIHLALTPETARFCNAEFFNALAPRSILVNTSRGGVIDEAALLSAANAKGLRVGLDVYDQQPANSPAPFTTSLSAIPGSAFTHHCGASTEQAQEAVSAEVLRMVRVFAQTGRLENCVNEAASPVVHAPAAAASPRTRSIT